MAFKGSLLFRGLEKALELTNLSHGFSFGLSEVVHRYDEWQSLLIARKVQTFLAVQRFLTSTLFKCYDYCLIRVKIIFRITA